MALLIALMINRTLGIRRLFRLSASINLVLTLLASLYLPIFKLGAIV